MHWMVLRRTISEPGAPRCYYECRVEGQTKALRPAVEFCDPRGVCDKGFTAMVQSWKTRRWALRTFLLVCLAINAASTLRAERLPVKIFTSADGLGSSFIDYLMRDSRGF